MSGIRYDHGFDPTSSGFCKIMCDELPFWYGVWCQ